MKHNAINRRTNSHIQNHTTATPGTLVFEGRIGEYDIVRALYQ